MPEYILYDDYQGDLQAGEVCSSLDKAVQEIKDCAEECMENNCLDVPGESMSIIIMELVPVKEFVLTRGGIDIKEVTKKKGGCK